MHITFLHHPPKRVHFAWDTIRPLKSNAICTGLSSSGIGWDCVKPVRFGINVCTGDCIAMCVSLISSWSDLTIRPDFDWIGEYRIGSEASTRNWIGYRAYYYWDDSWERVCASLAAGTIECVVQFILTGISQDAITLAWYDWRMPLSISCVHLTHSIMHITFLHHPPKRVYFAWDTIRPLKSNAICTGLKKECVYLPIWTNVPRRLWLNAWGLSYYILFTIALYLLQ
jgi:hypothetical protein